MVSTPWAMISRATDRARGIYFSFPWVIRTEICMCVYSVRKYLFPWYTILSFNFCKINIYSISYASCKTTITTPTKTNFSMLLAWWRPPRALYKLQLKYIHNFSIENTFSTKLYVDILLACDCFCVFGTYIVHTLDTHDVTRENPSDKTMAIANFHFFAICTYMPVRNLCTQYCVRLLK